LEWLQGIIIYKNILQSQIIQTNKQFKSRMKNIKYSKNSIYSFFFILKTVHWNLSIERLSVSSIRLRWIYFSLRSIWYLTYVHSILVSLREWLSRLIWIFSILIRISVSVSCRLCSWRISTVVCAEQHSRNWLRWRINLLWILFLSCLLRG